MLTLDDFKGQAPAWCPGCGNFGILKAVKEVLVDLEMPPHEFLIVSGIGQGAKLPHYTRCNTFNGLHGRTLPVATGFRLANSSMPVIAVAGDGDCYGEGGNHLIHAMRRNINVTLFVHNNQIYGLTKGQASPTTGTGTRSKVQPFGNLSEPLNPLALAVSMNCSFAARGYVGDRDTLKGLMREAILHKGFALLDILQPCPTFNRINTYQWYQERVYKLEPGHDPADRMQAFGKALEWGDRIPTGIIYRNTRPTFEEQVPVIREMPLAGRAFSLPGTFSKAVQAYY